MKFIGWISRGKRDTMEHNHDACEYGDCTNNYVLTYSDENDMKRKVCMIHWNMFCDKKIDLKDTTVYRARKRGFK